MATHDDGVPNAPPFTTKDQAVQIFTQSAVATHVPKPVIDPTAGVTVTLDAAVMSHFALTVKVPTAVADQKDHTLALTVASVRAFVLLALPSKELPALVASPVIVPIVLAVVRAVAVEALPVKAPTKVVEVTLVRPTIVVAVSPKEIDVDPIVIELLASLALAIAVNHAQILPLVSVPTVVILD